MEILDVVDEYGHPTGKRVERSLAHSKGIPHRTAHIWITRVRDGKQQVLLQRRAECKESYPLCYDTSSAGHISAGDEPLPSAIRELREELGISSTPQDFAFAGTFHVQVQNVFHGKPFFDNEIPFVYVYIKDVNENTLTLQKEEVESVKWFDLDFVLRKCREKDPLFCVSQDSLLLLQKKLQEL